MKKLVFCFILLGISLPSHAGRPLGTDDAATAGDRLCQVEAWREHAHDSRGWIVSPACGIGEFEIGAELGWNRLAESQHESTQTVALKWAPEKFVFGPVGLGTKIWTARARIRPAAEDEPTGWQGTENGALALASWEIAPEFAAHANLGLARDRLEHRNVRLANLALTWTPHERILLFAEAQNARYAGTTQSGGLRLWAIPEKFGIDFTASRVAGQKESGSFTIGFGWYGIFGE